MNIKKLTYFSFNSSTSILWKINFKFLDIDLKISHPLKFIKDFTNIHT